MKYYQVCIYLVLPFVLFLCLVKLVLSGNKSDIIIIQENLTLSLDSDIILIAFFLSLNLSEFHVFIHEEYYLSGEFLSCIFAGPMHIVISFVDILTFVMFPINYLMIILPWLVCKNQCMKL
ncbi:hypothetical protein SAY87_029657 [Trapa incisa]|uniref:Uncharacterized protein n=1 Tax=Trapa incisa TaxID=236973 RepID=A0AAN7K4U8_9MYRT|nr:hypothetical protein SAY87_029657 [Trapa incisa]